MVQSTEFKLAPPAAEPSIHYGPARGRINFRVMPQRGSVGRGKFTVFLTEHKPIQRRQSVFNFADVSEGEVEVLAGTYTLQVYMPGFETARRLIDVEPEQAQAVDISLVPREQKVRSFAERLALYGLDGSLKIRSLEVPEGQTLALNYMTHEVKGDFRMLATSSIADIKKWLGSDDKHFGHSEPVFGPLRDISRVAERVREDQAHLSKSAWMRSRRWTPLRKNTSMGTPSRWLSTRTFSTN